MLNAHGSETQPNPSGAKTKTTNEKPALFDKFELIDYLCEKFNKNYFKWVF